MTGDRAKSNALVMQALKANGTLTAQDAADATGLCYSLCWSLLTDAWEEGVLTREPVKGKGRKAYAYALVGE